MANVCWSAPKTAQPFIILPYDSGPGPETEMQVDAAERIERCHSGGTSPALKLHLKVCLSPADSTGTSTNPVWL